MALQHLLRIMMSNARRIDPHPMRQHPDVVAYDIETDGDKYIERMLVPKLGGARMMLHHILRPDRDDHLHDHPWRTAYSVVLAGGYREERQIGPHGNRFSRYVGGQELLTRQGRRISENDLSAGIYHRITFVEPDTWSLVVTGERDTSRKWGFLVDGNHVPFDEYLTETP